MLRWFPTLGGWLTMLNAVALVCIVAAAKYQLAPPELLVAFLVILSLPLTLPTSFVTTSLTSSHSPWMRASAAFLLIIAGVNCFVWGYGIEAIVRRCRARLSGRVEKAGTEQSGDSPEPTGGPSEAAGG